MVILGGVGVSHERGTPVPRSYESASATVRLCTGPCSAPGGGVMFLMSEVTCWVSPVKTLGCPESSPLYPAHVIFVNVCEDGRFCARDRVFVLGGTVP